MSTVSMLDRPPSSEVPIGTGEPMTEMERRLRDMIEAASDWFWETDSEFRFVYVSPRIAVITGIAPEALKGKRWDEVAPTEVEPEDMEAFNEAFAAREPIRKLVYKQTYAKDYFRYLRISGWPVLGPGGEFMGYRGVGADITAEKEAEARAYRAQERFYHAIDTVAQGIALFDSEQRLSACNSRYRNLHRTDAEQRTPRPGMTFEAILRMRFASGMFKPPEGDLEACIKARAAAHASGESDTIYELTDGRWLQESLRKMPDGGSVSLWTDITEIKQAEARRLGLEAQLFHSQKLEALGTLAGGIAHDLNNTLVPILALTKLSLRRAPEGSPERGNLKIVSQAAGRARDLVSQIVAFSRKDQSKKAPIQLDAIVGEALKMMRSSIPRSIDMRSELEPVPAIHGDGSQLHQVLVNLLANGSQAIGAAPGVITVCLRQVAAAEGGRIVISVEDTGCGMPKEVQRRIFEPFFTTRGVGEGTGLGLSVVHGIVTSHGGDIQVVSEVGKGSRFDVVLPIEAEPLLRTSPPTA
ncbi:MAG TPA: ATP-binding protein [Stellaceae bacterium]|nr:ATP-binding protein [Stellaceae bacterium]